MIDIRKLKELVKLMVENDLTELDLRDQEEKVTVRRGHSGPEVVYPAQAIAPPAAAAARGYAFSNSCGPNSFHCFVLFSPADTKRIPD